MASKKWANPRRRPQPPTPQTLPAALCFASGASKGRFPLLPAACFDFCGCHPDNTGRFHWHG
eukprot:3157617-Amphidinium_carterae.2